MGIFRKKKDYSPDFSGPIKTLLKEEWIETNNVELVKMELERLKCLHGEIMRRPSGLGTMLDENSINGSISKVKQWLAYRGIDPDSLN